ncbi:MAG: hypothetical protein EOO38_27420 [Cytophagaceae bacterium]|nr:MAG: hypothetical protein EOO38_27420 [Cytophagaceae bacterium]
MSTDKQQRTNSLMEAINAAIKRYDSDIYFYSGSIDDVGYGKLAEAVANNDGSHKSAVLILVTNGGLANSAYQMARLLQESYKCFSLWCPSRCKSAGTLVALGASKLIMDPFGDLGPLDVQLVKQNEIIARKSGLLAKSSFEALAEASFELYERLMIGISLKSRGNVSFKLASELSASMASTMMQPIYAQVNPEIVGSENRDLDIAYQYGSRLADIGGNATPEQVYQLVHGYPSHDFIIDSREAEQLFKQIELPDQSLYKIAAIIGDAAYDEADPTIVTNLNQLATKHEAAAQATQEAANEHSDSETTDRSGGSGQPSMDDGGPGDRAGDPEPANEDQLRSGRNDDASPDQQAAE